MLNTKFAAAMIAATVILAPQTGVFAASGGGFGLTIQNRADDYNGYVRLPHGASYAVCFSNQQNRRADAELSIDGLSMGTWRLSAYQTSCVDRPADDTGRFTFYRARSSEGYAVGSADVSRQDKGLVSVRYYPEIERVYAPGPPRPVVPYSRTEPMMRSQEDAMDYAAPSSEAYSSAPTARQYKRTPPRGNLGAGVTGLSGHSNQHFATAGPIERDYADAVTVQLRLVHDPMMDRPTNPRPLPGRYDRLAPPPVGY